MASAMSRNLVLAALLAVLAAPVAHAHGGHEFPHVNPMTTSPRPGGNESVELTFNEGMIDRQDPRFEAGSVFVLSARLGNGSGPVEVALRQGHVASLGATVAAWTVQGSGTNHVTVSFPAMDVYTLVFRNPGPGNASVTWFYDQSCNCAGKPIPVEVPEGLVVFNADVKKGSTWRATLPEPRALDISIALAKRVNDQGRWPQDFQVVQRSERAVTKDVGAGPVQVHELTWTADADARYYFFTQSTAVDTAKFDPRDPAGSVMITPLFEQLGQQKTPLGLEVPAGALLLALALAARRR